MCTSIRKDLIKEIEDLRHSKIICYIGGDRQNVSTRIAPDIIPVFYKHLEQIGTQLKIDLFIYTKGGDVHTALRLVELFYEFTNNFSVIVPFKAYSSGTLICLGAREISMGKMGELSPVDPNITSIFNPNDPVNTNAKLPINVEDVFSFFNIAKDVLNIKNEEAIVKIFIELTRSVHPIAIGSIHRTYTLIRSIARKLLQMHMDANDQAIINEIISNLTEKFSSHSYMITRKEAKEYLKLPVTYPNNELENKIWKLYNTYRKDLLLENPYFPEENMDMSGRFSVCSGVIESAKRTDAYIFDGMVQRTGIQDHNAINNINIIEQGWKKLRKDVNDEL